MAKRKDLDYSILKVVDDKHFVFHMVIRDNQLEEVSKIISNKKLTEEGMTNIRNYLKPYSDRLENIEIQSYDTKGNLLVFG